MPDPVFLLSSVRSGSTLLRCVLDSHSMVHSPHELHLAKLRVVLANEFGEGAMKILGVTRRDLEHLLSDRLLHRELVRSGKHVIVEKTPDSLCHWERLRECWPDARYIFLLRHPAHIVDSLYTAHPELGRERLYAEHLERFVEPMRRARESLDGIAVRYEDFTADPETEAKRICAYLDVPWEPTMLEYGRVSRRFRYGIGDWGDRIRSGRIQSMRPLPLPDEVPDQLRDWCRAWGYMPA
ncbi:sulfotransferase [Actinomadura meridiana]